MPPLWSWADRALTCGAVVLLSSVSTLNAEAVEDQPQIGFVSGETPVSPDPDPVDVSLVSPSGASGGDVIPEGADGIAVAVAGAPGIEFLDPDGTTVAALTSHPSDRAPVWSPGGNRLAFVSARDGTAAWFVLSSAGVVRIASGENLDWAWSPSSRFIAWVSHDLWVTDVVAGTSRNLTGGAREVWNPVWSPDSTLIAFDSGTDIFVTTPQGGSMVNLTSNDAENDRNPAWSPDGGELAFVSTQFVPGGEAGIYVMRSDGTGRELLATVTEASCGTLGPPVWSPDGSRVAFSASCGSPITAGIWFYVADRATGTPTLLGSGGGYRASGPIWSPTGDRLAFVTGGWSWQDVTIVDAKGRNPVDLGGYFPTPVCTGHPTWSPDGSRLAFTMQESCAPMGETPSSVCVADGHTAPSLLAAGGDPAWRPATAQVGLVDPSTGLWHLRGHPPFYYGNPGDVPFMGDWDCDGVDTPGLFRTSDASAYLRNSNTQGIDDIRFFFGNPGDMPLAGDFDGDGCDTLSLYRPSEQRFYIINKLGRDGGGLGAADFDFLFGNPGDTPVVGDWDGDGVDEVGVHREWSGFLFWRDTLTTGIADGAILFGNPGDRLVAGDWGIVDGADTPAVFRPGNTTFYFRHTLTSGIAHSQFTWPGARSQWLPVAGAFGLD